MSKPLEKWQVAWMKSRDDALLFATGVLDFAMPGEPGEYVLEPWQVEALKLVSKHDRVSIRSGHGVGKTAFLSIVILWFLLTRGQDTKIPVVATSQDQLRDGLWPEIAKWIERLPEPLKQQVEWQKERVIIKAAPESAFAVARTASKNRPEALQGFHARSLLAVLEEASGIPEETIEAGSGALSTPGAKAIAVGNPTRSQGFFYQTHHKLRDRWATMVVSSEDVPRARGHIDDIISLYGKNSNKYRVRVLGEFPTADDEVVIPLDLVLSAKGREVAISNVWPVWGVDVARFGDDTSTLAKRQGNTLLAGHLPPLREWHGLDGPQVAGRIIREYEETPNHEKPREIVVDVIGVGASVYDHLRLPGSPVRDITRGCNVAELPSRSEEDYRLRDELWFAGRAWFAGRDVHIPINLRNAEDNKLIEKLISELTAPTYDFTHLGKRVVESKKELKKRGVASPNLADALLNTFAAGIYPRETYRPRSYTQPTSWQAA